MSSPVQLDVAIEVVRHEGVERVFLAQPLALGPQQGDLLFRDQPVLETGARRLLHAPPVHRLGHDLGVQQVVVAGDVAGDEVLQRHGHRRRRTGERRGAVEIGRLASRQRHDIGIQPVAHVAVEVPEQHPEPILQRAGHAELVLLALDAEALVGDELGDDPLGVRARIRGLEERGHSSARARAPAPMCFDQNATPTAGSSERRRARRARRVWLALPMRASASPLCTTTARFPQAARAADRARTAAWRSQPGSRQIAPRGSRS